MINRLNHVGVVVADLQEAKRFLGEVLGLELVLDEGRHALRVAPTLAPPEPKAAARASASASATDASRAKPKARRRRP